MLPALSLIQQQLAKHQSTDLYVAYSGGVDSTALLYLACQLKDIVNIHALHIHHGLSEHADMWLAHCQAQAKKLGSSFMNHKLTPPIKKTNVEQWARTERYAFFAQIMQTTPNSLLMTAHHLEDQAETFLLQALRGNGLKGLAAIATTKSFAKGQLMRPFLQLTKAELIQYCQENKLAWIEDESNEQLDFRRNHIRHLIIPKLHEMTPAVSLTLARSARLCAESHMLLQELLNPLLQHVSINSTTLDLTSLNNYPSLQHKNILKLWLEQHEFYCSHEQLKQIHLGTQNARGNWSFELNGKQLEIHKKQLKITIQTFTTDDSSPSISTVLAWLKLQKHDVELTNDNIGIRKRQAADRCQPIGRHKSQKLKIIFQEHGISATEREKAWIIYLKNNPQQIIALYPFFVCQLNNL